jgi:hypothetical protein
VFPKISRPLQIYPLKIYCLGEGFFEAKLGIMLDNWRGARVDDWGGLENRCGFRPTVGSNPTLSAGRNNPQVTVVTHYRRLQSVGARSVKDQRVYD